MTGNRALSLLLLLSLFLAACGGGTVEGPPEIRYGEDACDQCQMIISEPRFAAAYVTEAGEFRRFDDTGEMFLYAADGGEAVRTFWVHDFHSEAWLEADAATFVHNPEQQTPMGWGVVAFAEESAAEAYEAEAGGKMLTATELQEQIEGGELLPEGMAGHNGAGHAHAGHDHEGEAGGNEHEMDAMSSMTGADQ